MTAKKSSRDEGRGRGYGYFPYTVAFRRTTEENLIQALVRAEAHRIRVDVAARTTLPPTDQPAETGRVVMVPSRKGGQVEFIIFPVVAK